MLGPDSSRYTGGQAIGNHKEATKEQLKARIKEAKKKLDALQKDLELHDKIKKESEESEEATADPKRAEQTGKA